MKGEVRAPAFPTAPDRAMSALPKADILETDILQCEGRRFGPAIGLQLGLGVGLFPASWAKKVP